ncbi:MAG: GC-type dockerin domain-anchored protein [Phycisphaerales bacterium]
MGQKIWSACLSLCAAAASAQADVVTDWNNVLLDTIRAVGGGPCPISRGNAMVHVAMFDAINSVDRIYEPYVGFFPCPPGASKEAAAAQAARDCLVHLYPSRTPIYDAALANSLAGIPNGPGKTAGISLGTLTAQGCIQSRSNDGTQNLPPFVQGTNPGDWKPTYPDFTAIPHAHGWGKTKPWVMNNVRRFVDKGPAGYTNMNQWLRSNRYAADFNEVKSLGALNSTTRTDEQTRIAFFWANDVNGTYKPPGHLNYITQVIADQQDLDLGERARIFALANLAMGDAGVAAWYTKYETNIDLWRPITGIREADTDNNPNTVKDANWEPINPFTPPFPAWASGHATFGGAHAGVMASFFCTDNITFTIDSEDPFYQALPSHPTRTFNRFSDAAWENAISRLYLGVHWRVDAETGNRAGLKIGEYAVDKFLRPRNKADFNRDGSKNVQDVMAFLGAFQQQNWRADFSCDGRVDGRDTFAFLICYLGNNCH